MHSYCQSYALPYRPDPTGYFASLRGAPGAVLLDSGRPAARRGRYDIMSAWPRASLRPETRESGPRFFLRLRAALAQLGSAEIPEELDLPFAGGLLGYLSYDFGRRLDAPADRPADDVVLPDAQFGVYDWALVSDHHRQTTQLVFHPACALDVRKRLATLFEEVASRLVDADALTDRGPESALTPTGDPYPEREGTAENAATAGPLNAGSSLSGPSIDDSFRLLDAFQSSTDKDTYRRAIERILEYIRAGDCYQVNYTQRFQAPYGGDPWQAYLALRRACPTPFAGYLSLAGSAEPSPERPHETILSLSPERFMRLQNRQIEARPIKGTRPRGATPEADREQADALCNSVKDRAENLMIVDLLRNDIGRSSRIGSVHVPELFSLESYPNVHHLVSCVRAELAEGLDAFDLLAGSFPGGSITGAPKIRAMQIIDELEPKRRSIYCGSLVYIDVRGEMDSSITIRTLLAKDGRISCWGGGGIVMDSEWRDEYQESLDKVAVLLRTLEECFGPPRSVSDHTQSPE